MAHDVMLPRHASRGLTAHGCRDQPQGDLRRTTVEACFKGTYGAQHNVTEACLKGTYSARFCFVDD
ncbi:hypothetical protein COLO4_28920 [Corchorus olitorius]|uniref:Uncharacterized protein n=1 Tax=Corchorus olitorius TaxID=93759 RepID=A0A1R3HHQ9_9ROSI|nr:hypothetical protein COLO4_28920 [Corchorus olitorius]